MKTASVAPLLFLAALAPLSFAEHVHSGGCCGDVSKFVGESTHAGHDDGENPRVALTANQRANLALRTEPVRPARIARTVFALGEIVADPRGDSAAASRVAGRLVELRVGLGDRVKAGDTLAVVEARQPGAESPARLTITAAADGTVDEVLTRLGEPVSPDAALLRLSDHTRPVVLVRVPQAQAGALRPGETLAHLTPEGGEPVTLRLTSLDPHADAGTGTVTARFAAADAGAPMQPGRRVSGRVILSEQEFPVTVARSAVQGEKGEYFVFIENAPGVYEKHPVVLGAGDADRVAVTGLTAGEVVVTHGGYALRYADASAGSLKAALDAAHGHAHGPNGEELGGDAAAAEKPAAGAPHTLEEEELPDPDKIDLNPLAGMSAGAAHDHAGHDHDHEHAGHEHAPAPVAPAKPAAPYFSGGSGEVLFATLAAGEAVLLGLALIALRRRGKGGVSDA